ncbi:MAG: hypothetical protein COA77_10365, partial [Thaumarchaeota archaeon]
MESFIYFAIFVFIGYVMNNINKLYLFSIITILVTGTVSPAFAVHEHNIVEDTTPQLGGNLDGQGNDITGGGTISLIEQAEANADAAGSGQIWVDTATPNVLFFTDDVGTDFRLNLGTSADLLGVLGDESGTGLAVFGTNPTLTGVTLAGDIAGAGFDIDNAGVIFLIEQ